jgi:glycosyltransferase involved in cell wall biosynthesis
MDLTIVLPCLNESETLQVVVKKAQESIRTLNLQGEVIVADNGSVDGSQEIALSCGAKLVNVSQRGYGAALMAGINHSQGKYIIMGDSDDSYAFDDLKEFIEKLDFGFDLVVGNRFLGGISKGAMPVLHRYLGNPVLSFVGKLFFRVKINDFHCGLRGFRRESILSLNLSSTGMEFASEMIVKASLAGLEITEVPTTLVPDGRSRKPHLNTWRDGWRHLIFLLMASPSWLFFYPGLMLGCLGLAGMALTVTGEKELMGFQFDLNTFFLSITFFLVGLQTILLSVIAKLFSKTHALLPARRHNDRFLKHFTLERGIVGGVFLILISAVGLFLLFDNWNGTNFTSLTVGESLRITGLFSVTLSSGIQILFASFLASIIQGD